MYDTDKRKLLSALCHGSIFFSAALVSIGVPIAILMVSEDPVVKESAKEAINFHLNVWLYGVIIGAIGFVTLGLALIVLGPLFLLFNWVPPILGIMKSLNSPDETYRYPFIFRVV